MFKENCFYRVTRCIDNRSRNKFLLAENDVVLVTRYFKNTELSTDYETRFDVDIMFDSNCYKRILWDKSRAYLLEEII